jgi:hypothetical protein
VAEPHGMVIDSAVSDFAGAVTSTLRDALGDDLVGLYLYGSAVSGGFDPGVSDVDLVAVTAAEVGALDTDALGRMHDQLTDRYPDWNDRLEIVYIGRDTLASFRASPGRLAVISPGESFHVREELAAEWLQNWYLVRETGICLHGAEAAAVVPPIAWAEYVAATVRYADELRARSRHGAGARDVAYTILTMCRALRTVRTHTQSSKQEAADWTREQMPEWARLIDTALECRLSRGAVGFGDEASRAAAERFIAQLGDEIGLRASPRNRSRRPASPVRGGAEHRSERT